MSKKVAVLIDFSNISGAFEQFKRAKGMPYESRIDYTKLVSMLTLGSDVVAKSVYMELRPDEKGQRGFIDFFRKTGFMVVTKEAKVIRQADGSTKNKANFDVEITFDACAHIWRRECSEVILMSGDSDFAYLTDKAKELDFTMTIVSSKATLSHELRMRADRLILLDDIDPDHFVYKSGVKKAA